MNENDNKIERNKIDEWDLFIWNEINKVRYLLGGND